MLCAWTMSRERESGHCIAKLVFPVNAQVHLRSLHLLRYLGITHILNATEDLLLPEPETSFQCAPAHLHMSYLRSMQAQQPSAISNLSCTVSFSQQISCLIVCINPSSCCL